MPKQKSHKGLLKRVKVTAKGKVKWKKPFKGHLMSSKSGKKLRQLRGSECASSGDIPRLERLLHRPLKPRDAA
jgi:large subunit ribosomal protein L35